MCTDKKDKLPVQCAAPSLRPEIHQSSKTPGQTNAHGPGHRSRVSGAPIPTRHPAASRGLPFSRLQYLIDVV